MNALPAVALVLAVAVVIVLAAVLWWRRSRLDALRAACRATMIQTNARSLPATDPLRLCGIAGETDDRPWTLDIRLPARRMTALLPAPDLIWKTPAPALPVDALFVIQRDPRWPELAEPLPGQSVLGDRFVAALLRGTLERVGLHLDRLDAVQNLTLGGEALRQNYLVLSSSRATAQHLLDHRVESLLLEWSDYHAPRAAPLTLALASTGLTLAVSIRQGRMARPALLERVITLGAALADALRPP